jgi:hypothetical protein
MSTLTPTATPTIGGRQKRKAVERLVIPTLQGRDYLPQGTVSYRPGHALEHNWTISEPNGAQHLVSCRIRTKPYGAFTVRYKTGTGRISELTKRVRSIAEGGNYPGFTIQAEMNEDATELHQAYVVRTGTTSRSTNAPASIRSGRPEERSSSWWRSTSTAGTLPVPSRPS